MTSEFPPKHAQILIVGGGPSGSYAAAALAREGFDVVLFEADQFPRYHVGESLIPSVRQYLKFIDAEAKVASHGFALKPGSAIKFTQHKKEGYTDFVALGHDNAAWNVIRSEFDNILLEHAASSGVRVFQCTKVESIGFNDLQKPVSATYHSGGSSTPLTITFDFIVDATGRAGLISTKYLKNRNFTESLKNVALWAYWKDTNTYGDGTARHGAPWFEALTDSTGWAWFIPLHNGLTSVGVVMNQEMASARARSNTVRNVPPVPAAETSSITNMVKTRLRSLTLPLTARPPIRPSASEPSNVANRYHDALKLAPGLQALVGNGRLVNYSETERKYVHMASDYSYSASKYAGDGWRIIGDAGAFVDPFFSSGVHLAFTSALSAAATISASIRGQCREDQAAMWHHERFATSYTRFLVVVLSAYKQIRAQSTDVLSDIDEDNFDKAFRYLRPVIQGGADMGHRISEDELQRALDFCGKIFSPTTPEEHQAAKTLLDACEHDDGDSSGELMDVAAPVIMPSKISQLSEAASQDRSAIDVKMILEKINARRVIHSEHGNGVNNFEDEALGGVGIHDGLVGEGFVVKLVRGELGLVKA